MLLVYISYNKPNTNSLNYLNAINITSYLKENFENNKTAYLYYNKTDNGILESDVYIPEYLNTLFDEIYPVSYQGGCICDYESKFRNIMRNLITGTKNYIICDVNYISLIGTILYTANKNTKIILFNAENLFDNKPDNVIIINTAEDSMDTIIEKITSNN